MFAFLNGTIAFKQIDYFVLDVNGVGYKIFCAPAMLARIPAQGTHAKIYTYMVVREDMISLYGFPTPEEQSMFEMLLSVSGVGPKAAALVTAGIEPSRFALAVLSSDTALISSVKGIGKKGAERIILELKDKLKGMTFDNESISQSITTGNRLETNSKFSEACSALVVLGYSATEANQVVSKVYSDSMGIETIIKEALKQLIR